MITIRAITKYLIDNYPDGVDFNKFLLRDDGEGVYIAKWEYDVDQPSEEQLSSIDDALQQQADEKKYYEDRAREYPLIGDQLDAIWKQFNAMRLAGDNLVQDADDMLGKILSVKNMHPKSNGE